jgi:hypothetical protein
MQIEHAAGYKTLHPLKILAYAYGRLPKVEEELEPWLAEGARSPKAATPKATTPKATTPKAAAPKGRKPT